MYILFIRTTYYTMLIPAQQMWPHQLDWWEVPNLAQAYAMYAQNHEVSGINQHVLIANTLAMHYTHT